MSEFLLPKRFPFRFSLPCLYRKKAWSDKGAALGEKYRLVDLAELEGGARGGKAGYADVRVAWSEAGLAFSVQVADKKRPPWCRETRLDDSDGLQVFIDTRNVQNVHRATRFCHHFIFLPGGAGPKLDQPVAAWLPIHRARENPQSFEIESLGLRAEKRGDGYLLEAFVPAEALTGYDPSEHAALGFTYAVIDRELGEQTLATGSPMPFQEDPSLCATLELVR